MKEPFDKPTIFEQATDLPLLDWEAANEKVVALVRRNTRLEVGIEAATKLCHLKKAGFCDINCKALSFCDNSGLSWLTSYKPEEDSFE